MTNVATIQNNQLTALEALNVMKNFLESHQQMMAAVLKDYDIDYMLEQNDIVVLLGQLYCDQNGNLVDQDIWQDWLLSIKQVVPNYHDQVTILQAYYVTKKFLENYARKNIADDVELLLGQMNVLTVWMNSVNFVLNN